MNGEEEGCDGVGGAPLVLEDVEADIAAHVDVGMEDRGLELDDWWGHGVVLREGHGEGELHVGVYTCVCALDGSVPVQKIVAVGEGADARDGTHHELHELRL